MRSYSSDDLALHIIIFTSYLCLQSEFEATDSLGYKIYNNKLLLYILDTAETLSYTGQLLTFTENEVTLHHFTLLYHRGHLLPCIFKKIQTMRFLNGNRVKFVETIWHNKL